MPITYHRLNIWIGCALGLSMRYGAAKITAETISAESAASKTALIHANLMSCARGFPLSAVMAFKSSQDGAASFTIIHRISIIGPFCGQQITHAVCCHVLRRADDLPSPHLASVTAHSVLCRQTTARRLLRQP